jgi:hypothetical protein
MRVDVMCAVDKRGRALMDSLQRCTIAANHLQCCGMS